MNLQLNQQFEVSGYDLVAHTTVFEGGGLYNEVIVLNNNSTHYLVALRTSHDSPYATFIHSFRYWEVTIGLRAAYDDALALMIATARDM